MLYPFVSSRGFHVRHGRGLAASVAVHVGLIALVIASPSGPPGIERKREGKREHVVFVETARYASTVTPLAGRRVRATPTRARRSRVQRPVLAALATIELPALDRFVAAVANAVALPDVDMRAAASEGISIPSSDGEDYDFTREVSGRAYRMPNATGLYTAESVEHLATPVFSNPKPRYPHQLARANVEGSFVVRFVVDTTGHVEPTSLEFPESAHRLFVASIRNALLRSRYVPAAVGGRSVRQKVEQMFSFVLVSVR